MKTKELTKSAIIVSLHEEISEIILLAESMEYNVITTFIQKREKPDVTNFVGIGKREEIKEYIDESEIEIDVVIIDGTLKPSQWFLLEKYWGVPVYDRLRLILMIFKDRADRKEARLQVRLAELQYERPFVRELIHRSRSGEHPGLMAGGEYQVDDYYEMLKKQMKQIKEKLARIRQQRDVRRRHRHHSGYYLISLAGYTNAGKSSLLNSLSDENIEAENRLFSTLSTTTRKLSQSEIPILMTDTVGFIQRLPAWIIDSFHSTLEEIKDADVVVLVVDSSDSFEIFEQKVETSFQELADLGVTSPVIITLNKIDLTTEEELHTKEQFINIFCKGRTFEVVPISVNKQKNLDLLMERIFEVLPRLYQLKIQLPNNQKTQSFLSWIYDHAQLDDITYGKHVELLLSAHQEIKEKILSKVDALQGSIIHVEQL